MAINQTQSFFTNFIGNPSMSLMGAVTSSAGIAVSVIPRLLPPFFSPSPLSFTDIDVISKLSSFRTALEGYHPGKVKNRFAAFQQQYEQHKDNLVSLKQEHEDALKFFEKKYKKVITKNFSEQKKNTIKISFNKFSALFKALITPDSAFSQSIKSEQLYKQLDQAISYLEDRKTKNDQKLLEDLKKLKEEFKYKENQFDFTVLKESYENTLKSFECICKEFQNQEEIETKDFFGKFPYDSLQMASNLLDEFNETILESHQLYIELDKVVRYIETKKPPKDISLQELKNQFNSEKLDQELNKVIRQQEPRCNLLDAIAEASTSIEYFTSEKINPFEQPHKSTQEAILEEIEKIISLIKKDKKADRQEMRFNFSNTDTHLADICRSCKRLNEKLQELPKNDPSFFTKKEKMILANLQKTLSAISYGKTFNKKDLQENLSQCHDIVKEILPNTIFTQITDLLFDLELYTEQKRISSEDQKKIIANLDSLSLFISNPRLFQPTKTTFEELRNRFASINPNQAIDLINTHTLFSPNERAFKDLKNKLKNTPNIQKELDRLCPLKKIAFRKLKATISNQQALDLLDSFINKSTISPEDKAQLNSLKGALSSIISNQEVLQLLDVFINDSKISCKANKQAFETLCKNLSSAKVDQSVFNRLHPLEKIKFEDLEEQLSSIVPGQEVLNLLDSLANSPNIPFQPGEKSILENLRKDLFSIDKLVLDCLYPLEKSAFEDLKESIASIKQEGLNCLNLLFNEPSFKADESRIKELEQRLSSIPDAFLDSSIQKIGITPDKKQLLEDLKRSLSSIDRKAFDYSGSITEKELKEKLLSAIPDKEIFDILRSIIEDPNISVDEKRLFENLKSHFYSIELKAMAFLTSFEKTGIEDLKKSLSSITQVISRLDSFINDPRIPLNKKTAFKELKEDLLTTQQSITNYLLSFEKTAFEDLKKSLSSITPDQAISKKEAANFQAQFYHCHTLIEKIKKRLPSKERNKIAIDQEVQKLAKHATNLSCMMLVGKAFFNPTRDSFFYRSIIQKAEQTASCPKKLLLMELQKEGASKWKVIAARICFFAIKHLRIESYIHKTISCVLANYSQLIYQKLDQEYNQDQFHSLIQTIIKNATLYFQLLSSAVSNAKEDGEQRPDQLTELIIKQLLLLKPQENEASLKELNLKILYNKLADDLIEKSESRLLKWIAPLLNKHKLISSIIEIGTDSFLNPLPNGNASTINVLLRDGLKTLSKKWPSIANKEPNPVVANENINLLITNKELTFLTINKKSKSSEIKTLVNACVENLIDVLNKHRAIQQVANTTRIVIANQKYIEHLKSQNLSFGATINPQIENLEKETHIMRLKLDALTSPALQGKSRQSLSIRPTVEHWKSKINVFKSNTEKHALPAMEVFGDKFNTLIRDKVDDVIREELTLALTELLEQPFSEDLIYDLLYKGLFLANQAIECPKENKEKQDAVKQEITELVEEDSFAIASSILPLLAKKYIGIEIFVKLAKNISLVPDRISPLIAERFQDVVEIAREKALFQPEAILQLGRRIILPVDTVA